MRINRFVGNFNLTGEEIIIKDQNLIHQVSAVLRLGINDELILCDGKGKSAIVRIISIRNNSIIARIDKVLSVKESFKNEVSLYCSILKRNNFEFVVQKATEVGASQIIPIVAQRTIKLDLKFDRLEKIIKEATEQSGRTNVPILQERMKITEAVKHSALNDFNIVFNIGGEKLNINAENKRVGIFIGPEGGWTNEEIEFFEKQNCQIISLSNLTLRAETAAIVGTYLLTI